VARIIVTLALLAAMFAASVASPAYACACGAYIPDRQGPAVVDEKALVRWDGRTEDIVMALGVEGTSQKAAWIMPVPSQAEITLAEPQLFDELAEVSKPNIVYDDRLWPNFEKFLPVFGAGGDGRAAPAVEVRGQQRLGPFDVTRLAADDPSALATWLGKQGFPTPPTLPDALRPYVEEGWEIVAIRLAPAQGDELGGHLQPLRLTFEAKQAVYPMRLSHHAKRTQAIQLYVLATHKMATKGLVAAHPSALNAKFAGRIEPGSKNERLTPYLADGTTYLTRFDEVYRYPREITADFRFARSTNDEPFRETIVVERDRLVFVGPSIMGLFILLAVVLVVVSKRNRRRRLAAA
jgi:hypothetical protein